jgi:hypothetical protein
MRGSRRATVSLLFEPEQVPVTATTGSRDWRSRSGLEEPRIADLAPKTRLLVARRCREAILSRGARQSTMVWDCSRKNWAT